MVNKEQVQEVMSSLNGTEFKLWYLLSYVGEVSKKEAEKFGISESAYYNGMRKAKARVGDKNDKRKQCNAIRKRVIEALIAIPDEELWIE